MKRFIFINIIAVVFLSVGISAKAQFRKQLPDGYQYTGNILRTSATTKDSGLMNYFHSSKFKMFQSFDMSFASMGGHVLNQNLFTNTMLFSITPRLTGRLDLSMDYSPMGQSFFNGTGLGSGRQVHFFVRNAQLNYQISKNSAISVHFMQLPSSLYYSPFGPMAGGYGYGGYGYNPYYGFNRPLGY